MKNEPWTDEDEKKDRQIAWIFAIGFILFMLACFISGKLAH